jgi:hypothetical protein
MENIMKFFNNSYELDPSIPMEEEDPLVGIMENEIKSLLQNKGINVVKITSEYEEYIDSIDIELEDKVLRFTGDDNGTPCIDVVEKLEPGSWGYGKIISTNYINSEEDLDTFVGSL